MIEAFRLFQPPLRLVRLLVLAGIVSLLDLATLFLVYAFGLALTGAAIPGGQARPFQLLESGAEALHLDLILFLGLGVLLGTTLRVVARFKLDTSTAAEAFRIIKRLFHRLFIGYLGMRYEVFIRRNSAERVSILLSDGDRTIAATISSVTRVATGLNLALIVLLLVLVDVRTFLFAAACGGLLYLVVRPLVRRSRTLAERRTSQARQMVTAISEPLRAYRAVVTFGAAEAIDRDLMKRYDSYVHSWSRFFHNQHLTRPLLEVSAAAFVVAGVALSFFVSDTREEALPMLLLLTAATYRILPTMTAVNQAHAVYQANVGGLLRLQEEIAEAERQHHAPHRTAAPCRDPDHVVEVEALSFSYEDGHAVLHGIDLAVGKDARVGVFGPSGSGKSTFIDIVLGLLLPTSGTVRLARRPDGTPVRIAYVPQQSILLEGTVLENIAFTTKATSDDRVRAQRLLEEVGLGKGSVRAVGLDDLVAEGGTRLSGGQRQRLGLARALFRQPDLLILDEPTSNLDPEAEEALTTLLGGLSVPTLLVSHRAAPLRICTELWRMEKGKLVPTKGLPEADAD